MNYEFDSAVRGYHYYRRYWSPQENEILKCYLWKWKSIWYFRDQNMLLSRSWCSGWSSTINKTHHKVLTWKRRRNWSAINIIAIPKLPNNTLWTRKPCGVIVRMPATVLSRKFLDRYKELVTDVYSEPQISEFMGFFLWWFCRTAQRNMYQKEKESGTTQYIERKISWHLFHVHRSYTKEIDKHTWYQLQFHSKNHCYRSHFIYHFPDLTK